MKFRGDRANWDRENILAMNSETIKQHRRNATSEKHKKVMQRDDEKRKGRKVERRKRSLAFLVSSGVFQKKK